MSSALPRFTKECSRVRRIPSTAQAFCSAERQNRAVAKKQLPNFFAGSATFVRNESAQLELLLRLSFWMSRTIMRRRYTILSLSHAAEAAGFATACHLEPSEPVEPASLSRRIAEKVSAR